MTSPLLRLSPLVVAMALAGCDGGAAGDGLECEPGVDVTSEYYDRFEGIGFGNACSKDTDCMPSGCSGEICAAESIASTCEALPVSPEGDCGCLEGMCVWQVCD